MQRLRLLSNMTSKEFFDTISVITPSIKKYDAFSNPVYASSNPTKKMCDNASSVAFCTDGLAVPQRCHFFLLRPTFVLCFSIPV